MKKIIIIAFLKHWMKKTIYTCLFISAYITAFSQTTGVSIGDDMSRMMADPRSLSGLQSIQTYKTAGVIGTPYLSTNWCPGLVTNTDNVTFSTDYLFMYNKQKQELYAKNKGAVLLLDNSKVASFTIYSNTAHVFKAASNYDTIMKGFLEVLHEKAEKYSLLKSAKTAFEKPSENEVSIMANHDYNSVYADHPVYFIYNDNSFQKIELKFKSIYNILPKEKVKEYFRSHVDIDLNEATLIDLVRFINT